MAESRDPMSKILDNVEKDLHDVPTPAPTSSSRASAVVESFAPQKHRNTLDSLEQIQQDFRKAVLDLENRSRLLIDELKRLVN